MNPPGDLRLSLARMVVEQGVALVGRGSVSLSSTWSAGQISQPQPTAISTSQGYLEELEFPE